MNLTPLQKRAERKSRNKTGLDMNLVSLIDIFTILIFFLLSSASGVEILPSSKAVKQPQSNSDKSPRERDLQASRRIIRQENQSQARTLTIMGDKDIPYRLLRKVMVTAARANFSDVSFAVVQ